MEKTRKRFYRQRIKCAECGKQIDSDYKEKHVRTVHAGQTVTFTHQCPKNRNRHWLSAFFEKHSAPNLSDKEEGSDNDKGDISITHTTSQTIAKNSFVDSDYQDIAKKPRVSTEPGSSESENISSDENDDEVNVTHESPLAPQDNITETGPNQPILTQYKPKKFGKESSLRDFKSEWFKLYPWLTYDIDKCQASCYPCKVFMHSNTFTFENWKKTNRLTKHAKSACHHCTRHHCGLFWTNKKVRGICRCECMWLGWKRKSDWVFNENKWNHWLDLCNVEGKDIGSKGLGARRLRSRNNLTLQLWKVVTSYPRNIGTLPWREESPRWRFLNNWERNQCDHKRGRLKPNDSGLFNLLENFFFQIAQFVLYRRPFRRTCISKFHFGTVLTCDQEQILISCFIFFLSTSRFHGEIDRRR